ncbi:MAG: hypothetical protein AABW67_02455 [Nanoarchaeota archaeon]
MKKIEGKKLAEGEMTGHAHVLNNSEVFELDNRLRIFNGNEQNTLTHQEHKPIVIPSKKGKYVSGKVLEYDHFTEEAKEVKD